METDNMYAKFNSRGRIEATTQQPTDGFVAIEPGLLANGILESDGTIREATEEEMAADLLAFSTEADSLMNRNIRNKLLSESDWVVTKALEAGETVAADWTAYRDGLRDLPDHAEWPFLEAGDWPTSP